MKDKHFLNFPKRENFSCTEEFWDAQSRYRTWVYNNATPIETPFYDTARRKGIDLEFQKEVKFYKGNVVNIIHTDFYYEDATGGIRVVIECDSKKWHEENGRVNSSDKIRTEGLELSGYKVFRFKTKDIWGNCEKCVEEVKEYIDEKRSQIINRNLKLFAEKIL